MARRTDDVVIKRMHNEGKSTKVIAEHFGVTSSAILLRYKVIGIDVSNKRRTPQYKVNERFFNDWSSDMAYVLGFILTDGNVSGNTISIAQKEIEPLNAIASMLEAENKPYKSGNIHVLSIYRKSIVESLERLGISEKKSLTVELPEVPGEYLADFIRGVIDGDGWVHAKGYVVTITSGSESFANQLTTRLKAAGFPFKWNHDGYAYRIKLSGKDEVRRLGAWLYANPTAFSIERKRQRILQTNGAINVVDVLGFNADIA